MEDAKQLFHAAQQGHADAMEQLICEYRPRVRRFVYNRMSRRLAQHADHEDILQETFLRSMKAIERIRWQGDRSLFSWFCGIAANVILEQERRFLRIKDLPNEEPDGEATSPSRHVRRQERFLRLNQSVARLSSEQQQVIRLVRIQGLSIREASQRLEKSEKATYQLLWRAMEKLKQTFEDTGSLRLPDASLDFVDPHG